MAGTNFFTKISPTCWIALTEDSSDVTGAQANMNQPGMVAKCIGTPPTTANMFGTGCIMQEIDTGAIFSNIGTFAVPVWGAFSIGSGGSSIYNLGNASGFAMLAGTTTTLTAFTSPSIIATGNTGEMSMAGVAGVYGSGSDTVQTAPYATAKTDVAALYVTLKALTGTAITTPSTLETNNLSGLGAGVFAPGVYTTASAINMTATTNMTLSGAGDYVFVSTGGAITFGATDTMILTNGATAARVFWVANNAITTGSTDTLYGNFMSGVAGAITIGSTNTIQGRLLSPVAITVDGTASNFSLPLGSGGGSGVASGTEVVGVNTTGTTLGVINTSVYTGTGVVTEIANALTSGVGELVSVTGMTTGTGLEVLATAATLTTGFYFAANDGALNTFTVGANGHLTSKQTTAPTIAVGTQAGITAAAITAGSTDTAGQITTTGTSSGGTVFTVSFNKTYTVAPKTVQLTALNAAATYTGTNLTTGVYVSSITATTFVVTLPLATGATPSWSYLVVG